MPKLDDPAIIDHHQHEEEAHQPEQEEQDIMNPHPSVAQGARQIGGSIPADSGCSISILAVGEVTQTAIDNLKKYLDIIKPSFAVKSATGQEHQPQMTRALKKAIERLHGCRATFQDVVPVVEQFEGRPVWEGEVHIFTLQDHPTASLCYAWASPIEGSEKQKFYAVLHVPPVASPLDAIRASIVQDAR